MSIFNHENDLENIRQKFAYIRANVELAAESRHFDINIELENFVGRLLNLVYGYGLSNTNRAISNAPGIDLQDEDLCVAVQVTSRNDSKKIKETIEQFNDKKLYKSFDRLIVFIITSKKDQYCAAFDTEGNFTFDRNRDIMDFSDVVRDLINENDHAHIRRVSDFLNDKIVEVVKSVTEDMTAPPFLAEFLGREDELQRVQNRLKANQHLVLVNGLGGIGKSALARKLYHEIRCRYDRVGWVSYQNTFKESLILAMDAEQFQSMDDLNQRYKAIYSDLKQDKKTLLVVDDVTQDTLLDPELQAVSALSNVSMLLTSRKSSITGFETVPVENLPEETCVQLFYRYSNHHHKETKENTAVIREIVRRAYYHTLLVELLAKASVHENSLSAYLAKLEQNGFDPNDFNVDSVAQQQKRVSDHLRKLYQLADFAAEPEKSRILWNFAIMPTMDIPREANEWIGADDLNKLQELIEAGWLSNRDGTYYMHELVKGIVLQERQEGKIPAGTADTLFRYVSENDFFPEAQVYTVKQARYAILKSVISYVERENAAYLDDVYMSIAGAAIDLGDYVNSERYYLEALTIRKKVLGTEHRTTGTTYNNLAGLYQAIGRYKAAEAYFQKALTIREKVLGTEHPDTGTTYNNLAGLYYAIGRYEEAEEYFQKALAIREKVLGTEHPTTGTIYNNLAGLYQAIGRYEDAEEYYQKALAISEKVLGTEHPDTGTTYNNLAVLYQAMGRYEEAEEYYQKALTIREKVLGTEHPDTGTTYGNLAVLYQETGRYEEAEEYYQKALAISEKVLGTEHPDTGTTYNNLAGHYYAIGRYEEAEEYFQKALAIKEKVLGTEHPDTGTTYGNLAVLYQETGRYEEAEEYYQKDLAIREKVLGTEHPDTGTTYNNLAVLYKATGRYEEAEEYYQKDLAISEKVLGTEHPDTGTTYNNLAVLYQVIGRYEEAEGYYQKALAISEKVLGTEHPNTGKFYLNIASFYEKIGREEEAETFAQKALNTSLREKLHQAANGESLPDS